MLDVSKFDEGLCYHNVPNRRFIAHAMLCNSFHLFSASHIVRNLEKLQTILKSGPADPNMLFEHADDTDALPIMSPLLDYILVATCFENVFKAELLIRRYIVHEIDRAKNSKRGRQQIVSPVKISDIKRDEKLLGKRKTNYKFRSLKRQTLPFSVFLNRKAYRNVLRFPKRTFEILEKFNRKRNSLHCFSEPVAIWSYEEVDDFLFLRQVLKGPVARRRKALFEFLSKKKAKIIFRVGSHNDPDGMQEKVLFQYGIKGTDTIRIKGTGK